MDHFKIIISLCKKQSDDRTQALSSANATTHSLVSDISSSSSELLLPSSLLLL